MKPIPEDTGSFYDIRTAKPQMLYVDKTAYLHRLISSSRKCFFLARPRRFGKSLMITTLKEIFNGRKDLFEGLAIAKTDYEWKKHPVLHFNFGQCANATGYENFERSFAARIEAVLTEVGCSYDPAKDPGENFGAGIDALAAKHLRCEGELPVILVDEYDDPVAKVLHDVPFAEKVRALLATFYGQLKDRTEKYRFLMITGVSKFTKMSIFSTLSNLIDLSFDDDYAMMLGYTEAELDEYFDDRMHIQAEKMGMTYDAYRAELRRRYNGYRFWKLEGENVYNPVSINLNLVKAGPLFEYYWSSTGRASTLMNYIKREGVLQIDLDGTISASEGDFDVSDLGNLSPIGMLYQTGYLTIADYSDGLYQLRVPDEEVKHDIASLVAGAYADRDARWSASLGIKLRTGKWGEFFDGLKALYAKLPYGSREQGERKNEFSYQRPLCALLAAQGFRYDPEVTQTAGRSDLIAEHSSGIWIFELKVGATAEAALAQIKAKDYAAPYRARNLPVWAVGLAFDSKTRQLTDAKEERLV